MLMRWPVASGPSPVARRTGRSGQAYQHASVETFTALSRGMESRRSGRSTEAPSTAARRDAQGRDAEMHARDARDASWYVVA